MKSAPKPCTQCGTLVTDGSARCQAHKHVGKFADDRRGSRRERGYGSAWTKIRARILRRDGGMCRCEECTATGAVRLATQVDHRINKARWQAVHGTLAGVDDDSNLQAINADCHKRKTAAEAREGRGVQKSGAHAHGTGPDPIFLRAQVSGEGGVPRAAEVGGLA